MNNQVVVKKRRQKTKNNIIARQITIASKEIQVFQETIKQCSKTVKS